MANYPPGGGFPPGGGPPGGFGGPPPGGMGGPPMGGMGGPPMGGMGGPPMGGMGGPPMGGMGGPPMGGMGGPPMGGMGGPMMGSPMVAKGGGSSKLKIIGGIIGFVVILVVGGIVGCWMSGKSSLYVVNTSQAGGLSVWVDGSEVVKGVPFNPKENAANVKSETVSAGKHKIEIKDQGGKVIETIDNYEFKGFFGTHLLAPMNDPKVCFIIQTDEFKTNMAMADTVHDRFKPLDPTKHIWHIDTSIDYWWRDTPDEITISTKKGEKNKSVIKHALRQAMCNDPNFQD